MYLFSSKSQRQEVDLKISTLGLFFSLAHNLPHPEYLIRHSMINHLGAHVYS